MRKRIWCIVLSIIMLFTACQPRGSGEGVSQNQVHCEKAGEAIQESPLQVMLIYMVGSDLETEAGMASRDIAEMVASGFDEEQMQLLLCAGGADYWWTEGITGDAVGVYEVSSKGLTQIHTLRESNMADPATLTEFIDYGCDHYPGAQYSMVLWNHGGGAVLGFGADEKHDFDSLSLAELNTALQNSKLVASGERFVWIGFDACLMAMLEVANVMTAYTDYLIASEEMEAGEGWNYACLKPISEGAFADGQKAAEEIISAYSNYYETNYKYTPDYTMACLDLSCTHEVIRQLDGLIEVAAVQLQENGYSKIAKMRDRAKSFGKINDSGFYDTVDLYDLSEEMMQQYPAEAQALQGALEDMVVNLATNVHGAHGVALYFPYENKAYAEEWLTAYENTGFSEEYTTFLKSFTTTLSGKSLAEWNLTQVTPTAREETPGSYYVQLGQEQYAHYGHAKYSVWEEDGFGSYICWITSTDVTAGEDGTLSGTFAGERFFIGDTTGNSMACCVAELERNEQYTKYAIPVLITPGDGPFSMEVAYIHFRVDQEHPQGEIIGIYEKLKTESSLFPNREVVELKEGDIISPFYFASEIAFLEDGSVGPYETWEAASGIGNSFVVEGDLVVSLKKTQGEYFCLFEVIDTQGNSYFTNPVFLQNK